MPLLRVLAIASEKDAEKIAAIASPNLNDSCEKKFTILHKLDSGERDHAVFKPHAVLHDTTPSPEALALEIHRQFLEPAHTPKVSIFTPTYEVDSITLERAYVSLRAQTVTDWEWVIFDDSIDTDVFESAVLFARKDRRVRVFKGDHSGSIGDVKRNAASLCRGEILLELDDDDELTPDCLKHLIAAFAQYPDAGFAYTDAVEWAGVGSRPRYPDGWAWGYGNYDRQAVKGVEVDVTLSPPINGKTIRYIVSCPNHARAWRRSTYIELGGHNPKYDVADDYELLVRTFLHTRMIRVHHCAYIQHFHEHNSQSTRLYEIQRLVTLTVRHYHERIKQRLADLGVIDCAMTEGRMDFGAPCPWPHNCNYEYFPEQRHPMAIVTACARPWNIEKLHESMGPIPIHWIIVEDVNAMKSWKRVFPPAESIHKVTVLSFLGEGINHAGGQCCKNRGLEFVLNTSKEALVYFLDDDNILYPNFVDHALRLAHERPEPLIVFQQVLKERPALKEVDVRPIDLRVHFVDQAQYLLRTACIGEDRIPLDYCGDGMFIETLAAKHAVYRHEGPLCFYNRLGENQ